LPSIAAISNEEYVTFVEKNKLFGLGLGFVDIHLLASSLISHCTIYTKDKHYYQQQIYLKSHTNE